MSDIRIGDEVYIHGFVDEVRKDVVIIKNEGGYFGTVADEIMPSAQSERPKGEWMVSHIPDSMLWECNQCGFDCGAHSFNFCPNCGADMRGGQDE